MQDSTTRHTVKKSPYRNVLALHSSPRKESITRWILDGLIEGMRGAGASVDRVNLESRRIGLCQGCFSC